MATIAYSMPSSFIEGVELGGEDGGQQTINQLQPLLSAGERVVLATGGEKGGALFTDKRIIVLANAGIFSKRSVIHFIRAAAIDGVTIDPSSALVLRIAGRGFVNLVLSFESEMDPTKIAQWCAEAMG
jgi:hypothetical protein